MERDKDGGKKLNKKIALRKLNARGRVGAALEDDMINGSKATRQQRVPALLNNT